MISFAALQPVKPCRCPITAVPGISYCEAAALWDSGTAEHLFCQSVCTISKFHCVLPLNLFFVTLFLVAPAAFFCDRHCKC